VIAADPSVIVQRPNREELTVVESDATATVHERETAAGSRVATDARTEEQVERVRIDDASQRWKGFGPAPFDGAHRPDDSRTHRFVAPGL